MRSMYRNRYSFFVLSVCALLFASCAWAEDTTEVKKYSSEFYPQLIHNDKPGAYWRMDLDEKGWLRNSVTQHAELRGALVGEIEVSAGPQAPTHPKFGDSKNDILEGLNANCWSVGVARWSINMNLHSIEDAYGLSIHDVQDRLNYSRNVLEEAGADYVIDTLKDLPRVIEDINSM